MFTDVVGFTAATQANEAGALARLREQETLVRPLLASFGGREVKSTGDGLLVEFPSALKAVECAAEIQRRLRERNASRPEAAIELRIGIHVGDVEEHGGDIFGDSVNVAARVVPLADPGGVCLSAEVVAQVRNKVPFPVERMGQRSVKGVQEPLQVYRVVLPWMRGGSVADAPGPPRLAVLPLANISPDPKDEYFADGLTEELIAVLSKLRGLRVIGRASVGPYRGAPKPVPQVGAELGVSSILSGSVRKAGDRIRVTLQLVDVASQEPTWTESYDRQLTDVFAIQSEVAERTAQAVRLELSGPDRDSIRRRPTSNLEAYDLYLRAVALADRVNREAYEESIALLVRAVEKDPGFALAHAYLGYRLVQASGDYLPHQEGFPRARRHIARALELDPELSDAHAAFADLAMQADHAWLTAESEFRHALELNPSDAIARLSYGSLLRLLGRRAEAQAQVLESHHLNPRWMPPRRWLADDALMEEDLDRAIPRARELLQAEPEPSTMHIQLAVAYAFRGRVPEARQEIALVGPALDPLLAIGRAYVLALLGDPEEARRILRERQEGRSGSFVPVDFIVALYVAVGENEQALATLEQAARAGESGLWARYLSRMFDPIRSDRRFLDALRSMGLPEEVVRRQAEPGARL